MDAGEGQFLMALIFFGSYAMLATNTMCSRYWRVVLANKHFNFHKRNCSMDKVVKIASKWGHVGVQEHTINENVIEKYCDKLLEEQLKNFVHCSLESD